jgi:hypothetical protein
MSYFPKAACPISPIPVIPDAIIKSFASRRGSNRLIVSHHLQTHIGFGRLAE